MVFWLVDDGFWLGHDGFWLGDDGFWLGDDGFTDENFYRQKFLPTKIFTTKSFLLIYGFPNICEIETKNECNEYHAVMRQMF